MLIIVFCLPELLAHFLPAQKSTVFLRKLQINQQDTCHFQFSFAVNLQHIIKLCFVCNNGLGKYTKCTSSHFKHVEYFSNLRSCKTINFITQAFVAHFSRISHYCLMMSFTFSRVTFCLHLNMSIIVTELRM